MTYYIEESDDEDEDDGEYNEATEEKDDQVSEEVTPIHEKGEILEGEVGSVQHRVEDPLITGVETLDQELGQRVSPATNQKSVLVSINQSEASID